MRSLVVTPVLAGCVLVSYGGITAHAVLTDTPPATQAPGKPDPKPTPAPASPTPTSPSPSDTTPTPTPTPTPTKPPAPPTTPPSSPAPRPAVMSSFTVNFAPAAYRTVNIGRAAELINGSEVDAGGKWSFNSTVGERTKENGFVKGTIINAGKYEDAYGGGVSAVATTVYNAVFFAGLKPVEKMAHSFYIERYPQGRDATVVWDWADLAFVNDTDHPMSIRASATDHSVTITFVGVKEYDSVRSVRGPRTNIVQPGTLPGDPDHCVPQAPHEGFDISVQRVMGNGGREEKRETFYTHYLPRDEVTCDDEEDNGL